MNNVNMANMGAMGGPVGAPMGMMNNGVVMPPGGARQAPSPEQNRGLLNTYIYEYFLRYEMFDCARAILNSGQPVRTIDKSAGGRRDENGNLGNGLDGDAMDTDSKDDIDSKRPEDLPVPLVTNAVPESCFLVDWFSMFWEMFNAQKVKGGSGPISQYVNHTQVRGTHSGDVVDCDLHA